MESESLSPGCLPPFPSPTPHACPLAAHCTEQWGALWSARYLNFLPSRPFLQHGQGRDKKRSKGQQDGFRDDSKRDPQIWNMRREGNRLESTEAVNLVGGTWGMLGAREKNEVAPSTPSSTPTSRYSRPPGPAGGGRRRPPAARRPRVASGTGADGAGLEHRGSLRGQLWLQASAAPSQDDSPKMKLLLTFTLS